MKLLIFGGTTEGRVLARRAGADILYLSHR